MLTSFPLVAVAAYSVLLIIDGLYAGLPLLDLPYKTTGTWQSFSEDCPKISRALMWGSLYNVCIRKTSGSQAILGPIVLFLDFLSLNTAWFVTNIPSNILHSQLHIAKYIAQQSAHYYQQNEVILSETIHSPKSESNS